MTVIFGIIAVIAGSVLIGYSLGQRTVKRRRVVKNPQIFGLEVGQTVDSSIGPATGEGHAPLAEPATDNQRAIAKAVYEKFPEYPANRQPTIRDYLDISVSIDFVMSAEDSAFLVDCLRRRLAPSIKPKAKGASA